MAFPDIPVIPKHPLKQLVSLDWPADVGEAGGCLQSAPCPAAGRPHELPGTGARRAPSPAGHSPTCKWLVSRWAAGLRATGTCRSRASGPDSDSAGHYDMEQCRPNSQGPSVSHSLSGRRGAVSLVLFSGSGHEVTGHPPDAGIGALRGPTLASSLGRPNSRASFLRVSGIPELLRRSACCRAPGGLRQLGSIEGAVPVRSNVSPQSHPARPRQHSAGRRGGGGSRAGPHGRSACLVLSNVE